MRFTITHNSGGFHGHQLKDFFGAITIGKIWDLDYRYTPYSYLDFFGINEGESKLSLWERKLPYFKQRISGPTWNGFESFEKLKPAIEAALTSQNTNQLIVFEKAFRVHPHQTIVWFNEGKIRRNIFKEIVQETTRKYRLKNNLPEQKAPTEKVEVAMHISRGGDFDRQQFPEHFENSYNVRYMFEMDYFNRIYQQIKANLPSREIHFSVYTEARNSEDIVEAFQEKKDVSLHIGCNRRKPNEKQIEGIFKAFVTADILVSCNSSFSTMAVYFRGDKPTIYHPHRHLDNLPEWPYLKTDVEGNFSASQLAAWL